MNLIFLLVLIFFIPAIKVLLLLLLFSCSSVVLISSSRWHLIGRDAYVAGWLNIGLTSRSVWPRHHQSGPCWTPRLDGNIPANLLWRYDTAGWWVDCRGVLLVLLLQLLLLLLSHHILLSLHWLLLWYLLLCSHKINVLIIGWHIVWHDLWLSGNRGAHPHCLCVHCSVDTSYRPW